MKKIISILLSVTILLFSVLQFASVTYAESVLLSGVWFESMYIEWSGSANGDYKVSYKETNASDNTYIAIDNELIREITPGKYRADILGLKGGISYDVKVERGSVIAAQFTGTPDAYDRSGFAFDGTNNAPGAYNADGTVADGALILYVSENNKSNVYNNKSITSILGGLDSLNKGNPVILRVIGKVTPLSSSSTSPGMWKNTCGVTIEGVGPGSGFSGWGIGSGDNSDTEFRNMNFVDYPEDAIGFEKSKKLWIHNNTFYSGYNPKDSTAERDKLHGDGSCDLRECNNVTVSYNHFNGTDKTSLIGSSSTSRESTGNITFHHNFFENTNQRTPRVRWHNIHAYNNYYFGTVAYGIGATCNSSIFAENNYFEDASSPFLTSSQGGYASNFSDNDGGVIKAYNNVMVNTRESEEGVDYFNAPSREYRMTPSDFTTLKGGYTYNNFDANGYIGSKNYVLHTPEESKTIALTKSGAMEATAISAASSTTPPEVTGKKGNLYYYDPDTSGSTGTAYGGINGTGTFFSGSGNCKAGTATGYRGTEKYNYSGCFSTGNNISFTTSSAAKFTIIASTAGNTPQRMEITNSSNPDAVYHGTFQTGNKGNDVLSTINLLEAGTYSFKPSTSVDIYYIEVQEYIEEDNDDPKEEPIPIYGDVNKDTKVNSVDASIVLKIISGLITDTSAYDMAAADYNSNGNIDVIDVISILNYNISDSPADPPTEATTEAPVETTTEHTGEYVNPGTYILNSKTVGSATSGAYENFKYKISSISTSYFTLKGNQKDYVEFTVKNDGYVRIDANGAGIYLYEGNSDGVKLTNNKDYPIKGGITYRLEGAPGSGSNSNLKQIIIF